MTGLDLDRIEATARAATPGRWTTEYLLGRGNDLLTAIVSMDVLSERTAYDVSTLSERTVKAPAVIGSALKHPDALHVATMDPTTTLALVARVREAEVALEGRCLADITLRDDDHRMVICILPEGHTFEHDDGMGCLWTDGGHGQADPATTRAPVERLRAAEARTLPTGDECVCGWHNEERGGGGYVEVMQEYSPACPQHSEHLYDPKAQAWVLRSDTAVEERLEAVDALHVAEYDDGPEVNVCFDDRAEWPCPTHMAIHPECDGADHCQHVGGAQ